VILIYRHRSGDTEWKDEHYAVVRTPCNLGGSRAWFICPAVGCWRRVAILYGGGIFACRTAITSLRQRARRCRRPCSKAR
jgi:hypothetical protein